MLIKMLPLRPDREAIIIFINAYYEKICMENGRPAVYFRHLAYKA
jgi:hypothetical protein